MQQTALVRTAATATSATRLPYDTMTTLVIGIQPYVYNRRPRGK